MSKKTNKPTKNNKKALDKIDYKNPADTKLGKVIIWIILFAMVGAVVFGLIIALITM